MIFTILLSCLTIGATAVPVGVPAADVPNQGLTVEAPAQPCPNQDPSQNSFAQQQQQQQFPQQQFPQQQYPQQQYPQQQYPQQQFPQQQLPQQQQQLPQQQLPQQQLPQQQFPQQQLPQQQFPQQQFPQQQFPQNGATLLPQMQQFHWPPLGGSPNLVPLQPMGEPALPVNQPPLQQQPLVYPSYGYYPVFMPQYTNQMFPQYRFPMMPEAQLPQTPANPAANTPVVAAEPAAGPAPAAEAPQTTQQQQNPQIVFMLQHPKGPALGGLSSEELAMAAELGQLSAYLPSVLNNPPPEAPAPVGQTAGVGQ